MTFCVNCMREWIYIFSAHPSEVITRSEECIRGVQLERGGSRPGRQRRFVRGEPQPTANARAVENRFDWSLADRAQRRPLFISAPSSALQ